MASRAAKTPVPFVDLAFIHAPIQDRMLNAIAEVVRKDAYILGPEVDAFEAEIAAFLGVRHAIGVSSGTDALLVSLMALDVGPGDEVITSPYSFVASANVISRLGARPVFVDIEPDSFNLDPTLLEPAITAHTKGILVPHLFGRPADLTAISAVARRHDLFVLEDAAQAIGAEWQGQRVGGLGTLGAFSFFPAKNLGALGDGGLVTTQDTDLAEQVRMLRAHGSKRRYMHLAIGGNFRLDALQAAVLRVKLPELEGWTEARQDAARRYEDLFAARGLHDLVHLPPNGPGRHVWNQYVIRVAAARRADVFDALGAADIGRAVYYPIPLHLQPCFEPLGYQPGDLPEAERAATETLAIPVAPGLTPAQQEVVVEAIAQALGR